MLTQTQAAAIILEYDTLPVSLLTKNQIAVLIAAKDVNKDAAARATAEFLGNESSKKYISPYQEVAVAYRRSGKIADIPHHTEKSVPVTTLVEFHDE